MKSKDKWRSITKTHQIKNIQVNSKFEIYQGTINENLDHIKV